MTPSNDRGVCRRRRRPAVVCAECRRRKVACNRRKPCGNCIIFGADCVYSQDSASVSDDQLVPAYSNVGRAPFAFALPSVVTLADPTSFPQAGIATTTTCTDNSLPAEDHDTNQPVSWAIGRSSPPAPANQDALDFESLNADVYSGDAWLEKMIQPDTHADIEITAPLGCEGVSGRSLGHSHWGRCLHLVRRDSYPWALRYMVLKHFSQFPDIKEITESLLQDKTSRIYALYRECSLLLRKAESDGSFMLTVLPANWREYIPQQRELCDSLVADYIRIYQPFFPVLHVATFQHEYEQFWSNRDAATDEFVIQLLLVMASVATCSLDVTGTDNSTYTYATTWISAAQNCFSALNTKRRHSLTGVQIHCLIIVARYTVPVGDEPIWTSLGSLLYAALGIRLHRDPSGFPTISPLAAEIRRRLWAAILEILVQTSLETGMPLMLSNDDFDCELPSNFDDADFTDSTENRPAPKPDRTFTQSSLQIALLKSLPVRLRIVKALNNTHGDLAYDEVLKLSTELTQACRDNAALSEYFLSASPSRAKPMSSQIKFLDLILRRFMVSLHQSWAFEQKGNFAYAFSRKACVDAARTILCYPVQPRQQALRRPEDDFLSMRLGSFGLRTIIFQAATIICLELITELREDSTPSVSMLSRPELYNPLKETIQILRQRILGGELSIDHYLFLSCALAHVDALKANNPIVEDISKAFKRAVADCYDIWATREKLGADMPWVLDGGSYQEAAGSGVFTTDSEDSSFSTSSGGSINNVWNHADLDT